MTSIRHYKTPRIVKLDGRYKFYPKFKYRVDFDTQGMEKWQTWINVFRWCENTWGKEIVWGQHSRPVEYRTEFGKNKYYRHLYLRDEQDITMMLLVAGV